MNLRSAAHNDITDPRDQIDLFILIETVLEDDVTVVAVDTAEEYDAHLIDHGKVSKALLN